MNNGWDGSPRRLSLWPLGVPEAEKQFPGAGHSMNLKSLPQYEEESLPSWGLSSLVRIQLCWNRTWSSSIWYCDLNAEHKFSALNSARFGRKRLLSMCLRMCSAKFIQTYFHEWWNTGQPERSLLIIEEEVLSVYRGLYSTDTSNSLHAANVEIIVKKDAFFRYTTIQNWSDNVYNRGRGLLKAAP